MTDIRNRAEKLRREGKSYGEIAAELGVAKSTLSYWLSELVLPDALIRQIVGRGKKRSVRALIKRNKLQTSNARDRSEKIKLEAMLGVENVNSRELMLIGAALYWAEGYKRLKTRNGRTVTYHAVSLTNSDPRLVNIFLLFLRRVCLVSEQKIRASIRYFNHQDPDKLLRYWSRATKISEKNFGKSLLSNSSASRGIRDPHRLPYGVIQISVGDTKLFYKIMGWIEGLANLV